MELLAMRHTYEAYMLECQGTDHQHAQLQKRSIKTHTYEHSQNDVLSSFRQNQRRRPIPSFDEPYPQHPDLVPHGNHCMPLIPQGN